MTKEEYEAQQAANAEMHEISQTISPNLVNHPLAKLMLKARRAIAGSKQDVELAKRRELETLASEEGICLSFIQRQKAFEELTQWPAAIESALNEYAVSDEVACDRFLNQMFNMRSNPIPSITDLRELSYHQLARQMGPALIAAMRRRIAEAQKVNDAWIREHKAVLTRHGMI